MKKYKVLGTTKNGEAIVREIKSPNYPLIAFIASFLFGMFLVLFFYAFTRTVANIEKRVNESAYITVNGVDYVANRSQLLLLANESLREEMIFSVECMPDSACELLVEDLMKTPKN